MDPNSKDLFAIMQPAAAGSLLPAVQSPGSTTPFNPFLPFTAYGINFLGLNSLGVAVHKLSPLEAALDRTVAAAVAGLPAPKAIKVAESTDLNGTILGNCQYGLPSGLDGCVIFTARTRNFITSSCGSSTIQTPGGADHDRSGGSLGLQHVPCASRSRPLARRPDRRIQLQIRRLPLQARRRPRHGAGGHLHREGREVHVLSFRRTGT